MFTPFVLVLVAAVVVTVVITVKGSTWQSVKVLAVIDGDTYVLMNKKGQKYKVRLLDVDCPEMDQTGGEDAKRFVQNLMYGKWVDARFKGRDKYGRFLASVKVDGQPLGRLIVQAGMGYPLPGASGLRLAYWSARLSFRGAHGMWGNTKPWQARSRMQPAWWRSAKYHLFRKKRR